MASWMRISTTSTRPDFLMGQISTTKVVTSSEKREHVKLIQPGNREWVSAIIGVNFQGWSIIMHKMVLLKEEITRLREANQILSQRLRANKKRRVRHGGHLSIQDAQDQESQKDVQRQLKQEERANRGRAKRIETRKALWTLQQHQP